MLEICNDNDNDNNNDDVFIFIIIMHKAEIGCMTSIQNYITPILLLVLLPIQVMKRPSFLQSFISELLLSHSFIKFSALAFC